VQAKGTADLGSGMVESKTREPNPNIGIEILIGIQKRALSKERKL